jgi:hypothetical protein
LGSGWLLGRELFKQSRRIHAKQQREDHYDERSQAAAGCYSTDGDTTSILNI